MTAHHCRYPFVFLFCLSLVSTITSAAAQPADGNSAIFDTVVQRAAKLFDGNDLRGKDGPMRKLGYDLALIYEEYRDYQARGGRASLQRDFASRLRLARTGGGMITLDAFAATDTDQLAAEMERMGMHDIAVSGRVVSGRFPIGMLARLARSSSLQFARPSYAITQTGAASSQGDIAQASDTARLLSGLDGSGVTVGVLSDSYNCTGGAAGDVASGDLPSGVVVLDEENFCSSGTDEGRAMMQIVHDVAPGADLAFHTAFNGMADFANGIVELATIAHADVITDDVIYLSELMFQDGEIAQAVDTVNALGVSHFSSAGNQARQSYEADFVDSGVAGHLPFYTRHDFDPTAGVDTMQAVTIPNNSEVTIVLQWQDPAFSASGPPGAATDLDLFLYNEAGTVVQESSTINNIGGDPVELISYFNSTGVDKTLQITIEHVSGPVPGRIKYVYFGSMGIQEYKTDSSTLYGHSNASGAIATGAARYDRTPAFGQTPPRIESFSALGGTPILYDNVGNPVNITRQKPDIVAPDGGNNTFFGSDYEGDGLPNFFGTSAAAPHAAGVAALLKQLDSSLTTATIYFSMILNTIDMGTSGFDHRTGYGLLQADAVLLAVDRDADGVINDNDNCPDDANPLQQDFDNDSLGDACDEDDDNDQLLDVNEVVAGSDPFDPDSDMDGVEDGSDNCILVANTAQRDTDGDNFGNFCDPDFDNNLVVNFTDLTYMKSNFFSSDADADLDGNSVVNFTDLAIIKQMFFGPPGPSVAQFQGL